MKIGLLCIYAGKPYTHINGGEWDKPSNMPHEMGGILKTAGIQNNDTDSILVAFKYILSGLLLCISKREAGRGGNTASTFRALWVFIPDNFPLNEHFLNDLITNVKELICKKDLLKILEDGGFNEPLLSLFYQDYEPLPYRRETERMAGKGYAIIDSNDVKTLSEIVLYGWQEVYKNYGLIIFANREMVGNNTPALDASKFKKAIRLMPSQKLPEQLGTVIDFKTEIFDGKGWKLIGPEGIWEYPGNYNIRIIHGEYLPIEGSIHVKSSPEEQTITFGSEWNKKRWMKKLDLKGLSVLDESGNPLIHYCQFECEDTFDKNGNKKSTFSRLDEVYYPISQESNLTIMVSSDGFKAESFTLKKLEEPNYKIILKTYSFEKDYSYGGCNISIKITGRGTQLLKTEGFEFKNERVSAIPGKKQDNNDDYYRQQLDKRTQALKEIEKKKKALTYLLLFFIAAAILFLVLWLTKKPGEDEKVIEGERIENTNSPGVSAGNETDKNAPLTKHDIDVAIQYLDKHTTWDKANMEAVKALRGLFDDMNNMDLNQLSNKWKNRLSGSERFKRIAEAADKNISRNWNPKVEPHYPTYNTKRDDYAIDTSGYILWLDNECTKHKVPSQQPIVSPSNNQGNNGNNQNKGSGNNNQATQGSTQSSSSNNNTGENYF